MKKIISALATVVMCLTMICSAISVSADSMKVYSSFDGEAKPGDIIAVDIKVDSNPGIWGLDFDIFFDTSVFQVHTIVNGDMFTEGSGWPGVPLTTDYIDRLNSKGKYHFVGYADTLTQDVTKNGTLCTMLFKVDEEATAGDYEIKLQLGTGDIVNCAEKKVSGELTGSTIKIVGTAEENVEPQVPTVASSKVIAETKIVDYSGITFAEAVTESNGKVVTKVVENVYETGSPRDVVSSKAANGEFNDDDDSVINGNDSNTDNNSNDSNSSNSSNNSSSTSDSDNSMNGLFIVIIVVAVICVGCLVVILVIFSKKKQ